METSKSPWLSKTIRAGAIPFIAILLSQFGIEIPVDELGEFAEYIIPAITLIAVWIGRTKANKRISPVTK